MRQAVHILTRPSTCRAVFVRRKPRSPLSTSSFGHYYHHSNHASVAGQRSFFTRRSPTSGGSGSVVHDSASTSSSSMRLRSFSAAVAAAAVAGGAYYLRGGIQPPQVLHADSPNRRASSLASSGASIGDQAAAAAAQTTRKALIVEQGQIYSGNIVGDGPLEKTDASGRSILEMLTPEQATQKLRRNEESWFVNRGEGVVRYDLVQLASNNPIEDDHVEKIIEMSNAAVGAASNDKSTSDWMFWGVFDGHSGWTTSAKLRQQLVPFVARELNSTYRAALTSQGSSVPTSEAIDAAMKKGFVSLDNDIVHTAVEQVFRSKSKNAAAELLAPALSGSCALLSFYDAPSKTLRVACTGDSRAVLGRKGANGKWTAVVLSEDQTGANQKEAARLRAEHPGEPHVVKNGRVLGGLEPTRAFGDAVYKWTQETADKLKKSYFSRTANSLFQTPPYVTAEPVVTTTQIQPERGDFLVLATDGLWEMLTNEEAVGLVGKWLEVQAQQKKGSGEGSSWLSSWFASNKSTLPVEEAKGESSGNRDGIRKQQWGITGGHERFVVEDENAATHLIRNALGGKDTDQLCALLTLPSPISRRYRDDLTVQVIFFGADKATGNIIQNSAATANDAPLKAKL